jgi:hypothetical protein
MIDGIAMSRMRRASCLGVINRWGRQPEFRIGRPAPDFCGRIVLAENRFPLFGTML